MLPGGIDPTAELEEIYGTNHNPDHWDEWDAIEAYLRTLHPDEEFPKELVGFTHTALVETAKDRPGVFLVLEHFKGRRPHYLGTFAVYWENEVGRIPENPQYEYVGEFLTWHVWRCVDADLPE